MVKIVWWLHLHVVSSNPVSTTNKTVRHDITEILLKVAVALNTIKPNQSI